MRDQDLIFVFKQLFCSVLNHHATWDNLRHALCALFLCQVTATNATSWESKFDVCSSVRKGSKVPVKG